MSFRDNLGYHTKQRIGKRTFISIDWWGWMSVNSKRSTQQLFGNYEDYQKRNVKREEMYKKKRSSYCSKHKCIS